MNWDERKVPPQVVPLESLCAWLGVHEPLAGRVSAEPVWKRCVRPLSPAICLFRRRVETKGKCMRRDVLAPAPSDTVHNLHECQAKSCESSSLANEDLGRLQSQQILKGAVVRRLFPRGSCHATGSGAAQGTPPGPGLGAVASASAASLRGSVLARAFKLCRSRVHTRLAADFLGRRQAVALSLPVWLPRPSRCLQASRTRLARTWACRLGEGIGRKRSRRHRKWQAPDQVDSSKPLPWHGGIRGSPCANCRCRCRRLGDPGQQRGCLCGRARHFTTMALNQTRPSEPNASDCSAQEGCRVWGAFGL